VCNLQVFNHKRLARIVPISGNRDVPPYSRVIRFKTYCGYVNPRITCKRTIKRHRWKKPTNAQEYCKQFIALIKSPTCFGIQMPSSVCYLFLFKATPVLVCVSGGWGYCSLGVAITDLRKMLGTTIKILKDIFITAIW
jgi:hypothetical protein